MDLDFTKFQELLLALARPRALVRKAIDQPQLAFPGWKFWVLWAAGLVGPPLFIAWLMQHHPSPGVTIASLLFPAANGLLALVTRGYTAPPMARAGRYVALIVGWPSLIFLCLALCALVLLILLGDVPVDG